MLLNASQNISHYQKLLGVAHTLTSVHYLSFPHFKPSYLHSTTLEALLVCHNCPLPVNYSAFMKAKAGGPEGFLHKHFMF